MTKMEIPSENANKIYEVISRANDTGKIRKGANEATKAIERKQAVVVAMADNTSPKEILAHIPALCDEKGIHYIVVPKKEELGKAAGLTVSTSAVAVVDAGEGKKILEEIIKSEAKPAAKKAEEKKEEKKEEKAEEKPKAEKPVKEKKEKKPAEKAE